MKLIFMFIFLCFFGCSISQSDEYCAFKSEGSRAGPSPYNGPPFIVKKIYIIKSKLIPLKQISLTLT